MRIIALKCHPVVDDGSKGQVCTGRAECQGASGEHHDTVLAAMTGPEAKSAAEFKAVWDQFKATRENENYTRGLRRQGCRCQEDRCRRSGRPSLQDVGHHVLQNTMT